MPAVKQAGCQSCETFEVRAYRAEQELEAAKAEAAALRRALQHDGLLRLGDQSRQRLHGLLDVLDPKRRDVT